MTEIQLDDRFHKDVMLKDKVQTIRKGRRDYPLGDMRLTFKNSPNMKKTITAITYKRLGNVTKDEAMDDGFRSLSSLVEALRTYYPDINLKTEVTLIRFK